MLRYGAYSDEVLDRLRWMEEVMAPVLADAVEASGGIDIRALLAEALHMGDEGHNRNKAGSILYTAKLAPFVAKAAPNPGVAADILSAHDLVGLTTLEDTVLVDTGLVCEGIGTHDGLVGLYREAGDT